jgi:hypothetical protein
VERLRSDREGRSHCEHQQHRETVQSADLQRPSPQCPKRARATSRTFANCSRTTTQRSRVPIEPFERSSAPPRPLSPARRRRPAWHRSLYQNGAGVQGPGPHRDASGARRPQCRVPLGTAPGRETDGEWGRWGTADATEADAHGIVRGQAAAGAARRHRRRTTAARAPR